jgi:hypothetical protein
VAIDHTQPAAAIIRATAMTLRKVVVIALETSLNIYHTKCLNIPESSHFHTRHRENLKAYHFIKLSFVFEIRYEMHTVEQSLTATVQI